jgi:hemerythrin superfamily protein
MDAIELLTQDHRIVERLFRDYEAAASDDQRRAVVELLVRALSKHAAVEELMVYPLVKDVVPDGHRAIEERLEPHTKLKFILRALDKLPADAHEATDDLMAQLQRAVDEHVRADEVDLLPKLRDAVDEPALDELGQVLDHAKQVAPTRPDPHAPDRPPTLGLAAPVAAAYDRLRNRMQRRPPT